MARSSYTPFRGKTPPRSSAAPGLRTFLLLLNCIARRPPSHAGLRGRLGSSGPPFHVPATWPGSDTAPKSRVPAWCLRKPISRSEALQYFWLNGQPWRVIRPQRAFPIDPHRVRPRRLGLRCLHDFGGTVPCFLRPIADCSLPAERACERRMDRSGGPICAHSAPSGEPRNPITPKVTLSLLLASVNL